MRSSAICLIGLMFLAGALCAAPSAHAGDQPRIMIILDASGSMWGQIQGKAKIEIAREVMTDLLRDWDPNIQLGLTAYGHRRKGDCKDIEVIIPTGKGTSQEILRRIPSIQPRGKTPLSDAVSQAAQELRYTEERAAVVLISDGVETCDADPCEVGAELAMAGADFTTHVIGFDVKDEEQVGLRCLAENTGGLFLAAADAEGLRSALFQMVKKAKAPPPPVVEEPGEALVKAPDQVPAGSLFKVQWEGPDSRNDFVTLVPPEAPEGSYLNYTYTSRGNPVSITAPDKAGAYEIRYVFGHTRTTLGRADILVTPVEASLELPAEMGAGSLIKVKWTGPDNKGDYITIVPEGANNSEYLYYAYTGHGNPASVRASDKPGKYEMRYIMGQSKAVLARAPITLTPVSAKVVVPASAAAGSNIKVVWKGPDNKGDYITIVPEGADDSEYLKYAYTAHGNPASVRAPDEPGKYEMRYIMGQSKAVLARAPITLTPVSAKVVVPASASVGSNIKVDWQGPDYKGDYITIVPSGAGDNEYLSYAYTSHGNPASLKAPDKPGNYEVRYILGQSKKVLGRLPIKVK